MTHYKIINDEKELDNFISWLPDIVEDEVYYICLFGRHKYCPEFPNTRDNGQLARLVSRKEDIKEKIRRLESPVGSYSRNGVIAPQNALAMYVGLNPRSFRKANQDLLIEFAKRFSVGETGFNPITLSNTSIHRATSRKMFVDFDYDNVQYEDYLEQFNQLIPGGFKILKTRGGFHLIVEPQKCSKFGNWYKTLSGMKGCDVKGSNGLLPIPGCVQGDFTPYFAGL